MSGSQRRVRAPFVVVGLLLAALGAVGAWTWGQSVGKATAVVVTTEPLVADEVVTPELLKTLDSVDVAADGGLLKGLVPFVDVETLLGKQIVGPIPAGTTVSRALVVDPSAVDTIVVSADVPNVAKGVKRGDRVDVWDGEKRAVVATATIKEIPDPTNQTGQSVGVDLVVDKEDRDAVQTAADNGKIALQQIGGQ